jgi:uroporphyrin-III C-methyltransferase
MQLEIDVQGRKVLVFGSHPASHRVIKRYHAAGARVTAVVDGPMPGAGERLPGVRYAVHPENDHLSDWINLLGPAWLVVLVGADGVTTDRVTRLCGHLRIVVGSEPAAVGHGMVTLVGGGPGITGLLTVQGGEALREADVVFYDRLGPSEDLPRLAPTAELVDVGKRPHHHPVSQFQIQTQMIARARQGASVVRLKGGDPFVFGRGGEEARACLQAGVPVRVVPGVSSALSVPAAVGIPLTHRGVSRAFTVISGHDPLTPEEFSALARLEGTLVILMGINNLPQISAGLVKAGLPPATPAAVIERGFSSTQRTTVATVDGLAAEVRRVDVQPPAVIVIGEVVRLVGIAGDGPDWLGGLESAAATTGGQGAL